MPLSAWRTAKTLHLCLHSIALMSYAAQRSYGVLDPEASVINLNSPASVYVADSVLYVGTVMGLVCRLLCNYW